MPPDTVRLFGEPLAMAAAGALFQVQDAVQLIGGRPETPDAPLDEMGRSHPARDRHAH